MRKVFTILSLFSISFLAGAQTTLVPDNYNPMTYEIPLGHVEGTHYLPKKIIFKLKEGDENALASPNLLQYLQSIGAHAELMFPQAEKPIRKTDVYGRKFADLTRIYEASYTSNVPVKEVMALLKKSGLMEYVQPKIIVQKFSEDEKINFVPNDPDLASQWHITKINAPQAWDVSTGSPSVIVGIPDGGTNLSHPDLLNIAYNTADPIDGIDNDGDGWIDNYQGWNTGSNNNNPQYNVGGGLNHGVASTGTASATVNNGTNGAGISYNSPYLPIKIADASNSFSAAEQGVFYAAQKGAKIINCSWGGTSPWPLLEDITRYAVFNKGCFVVSSAGNSNNSAPYWPGSYPWVTCVAGSNSSDIKSSSSSYYDFVDITAPGEAIFTTSAATFANVGTGTSWAAPMVSGSAALVRSHFPSYTPEQVDALLKETSFNLYALPGNAIYADKLGRGRLDIGAALTTTPGPSIKMATRDWTDGNDNSFSPGEDVSLSGNFVNWLNPSSASLRCTLTTSNPYVAIIDSVVTIGILNNLATFNNSATPFRIHIGAGCPANTNTF
jgi:serine protease